jgi:hypothetical protein
LFQKATYSCHGSQRRRRERCWEPTLSACKVLISLGSDSAPVRTPSANSSGLSKNAAVLQPLDHRFTVTGPQPRRSSFRTPRGRLRYPDRLLRPRWRPSQSCTNIQLEPLVGGRSLPACARRPSFCRRRQSYTCKRVAPYRFATSETDIPGRRLCVAIRARSASLRSFRPIGPSRTSRRVTRPVNQTSNWASILPSTAMIRNPIQNWIRYFHAEHGLTRMGSVSYLS